MASTFITNACEAMWNIVLLSTIDAWELLPSYEEVFELLSDVGLQEQLGPLSVILQQPLIRIAMGRLLGVLKDLANAKSELETSKILILNQSCLLDEKENQAEALQMENGDLTADLEACKETIASLQQQLEAKAQAATPGATQDHNAALESARSKQAEAERTVRDLAAVAAAAERRSASLEAAMQQQEDIYENEIASLTTEIEEAQAAAGAVAEQVGAEACTSKKLQERLQETEIDRDSFVAALTAEQEAGAKAKQSLAYSQRLHGDHIAVLGLFAQQQTKAREATEAENRMLRSRLSCLEEQLCRHSVSVDQSLADSSSSNHNGIPADAPTAASSGASATSAGHPGHMASQVAEAARESLPEILPAQEDMQRRQSVPADMPRPVTPAGFPTAAPSSTAGASAGAPEETVPQEEEPRSSDPHTSSGVLSAAVTPVSSTCANDSNSTAVCQPYPAKKPSGLMGACITGAALAAALNDVTVKYGSELAKHLRTSAANVLVTAR